MSSKDDREAKKAEVREQWEKDKPAVEEYGRQLRATNYSATNEELKNKGEKR